MPAKSKQKQINLDSTFISNRNDLKTLSKEQWEEIHPALTLGFCGTKKHRFLLTVASPYLTVSQKSAIVDKINITPGQVEKMTEEILYTLFNFEALNFLTIRYPKVDILRYSDMKNFHYRNSKSILSVNEIVTFLIKKHPLYGPSRFPHRALTQFMLLGVDFREFLPKAKIDKVIEEQMLNFFSHSKNQLELLYRIYRDDCNRIFYTKKPQLELFSDLLSSGPINVHNHATDAYITNLKPMNLKPWAKENFGFSSAKLLNYLKEVKYLNTGIFLMEDIKLLQFLLKDHNLIWQVLPETPSPYPTSYFSYHIGRQRDITERFSYLKDMLSPEQFTILFKELYVMLSTSADSKDKSSITEVIDTLNMIYGGQKGGENLLIKAIKENYRFNDYNTWHKFHDVCSLLYNKLKNPEKSLNIDSMYPGLNALHNTPLSPELSIFVPQTNLDMIGWGQKLRICVGSYWESVAMGRTLVLGLYEAGQIKYCLEYSIESDSIRQLKGHSNYDASKEIRTQTKAWLNSQKELWEKIKVNQIAAQLELAKKEYKNFKEFVDKNIEHPEFHEEFKPVWAKVEKLLDSSNKLDLVDAHLLKKITHFFERVEGFLNSFSNRSMMEEHMLSRMGMHYGNQRDPYGKIRLSPQETFILEMCNYLRDMVQRHG